MSVLALARGSIILRCAGIALAVVFTLSSGFAHAQMPAQDAAAPAVEGPTLSSENLPPPTIETRPEPLPSPDIDFQPSWDSVNLALSEPDLALDPPSNPFWAGRRTGVSWLAAGGPAAFGITEFELGLSLAPIRRDSGAMLSVTPGFGFHAWSGARQLELPGQVFDTYLDINWQQPLTERWTASFGVTPGMYGDYASFKSDVFQVTGWGLMSYYVGPKLTLLGGAAVVRQLESHVLPVGGFVWMPSEDWRIEALFPRPRIARRFMASMKQNAWAYVAGQFGGGSWSVTLEDATSTLVTYSDLRVLAGFEWLGGRQATAIVEAGYVFGRDISAFGISQFTPEDTVLLHAGLTF